MYRLLTIFYLHNTGTNAVSIRNINLPNQPLQHFLHGYRANCPA